MSKFYRVAGWHILDSWTIWMPTHSFIGLLQHDYVYGHSMRRRQRKDGLTLYSGVNLEDWKSKNITVHEASLLGIGQMGLHCWKCVAIVLAMVMTVYFVLIPTCWRSGTSVFGVTASTVCWRWSRRIALRLRHVDTWSPTWQHTISNVNAKERPVAHALISPWRKTWGKMKNLRRNCAKIALKMR